MTNLIHFNSHQFSSYAPLSCVQFKQSNSFHLYKKALKVRKIIEFQSLCLATAHLCR